MADAPRAVVKVHFKDEDEIGGQPYGPIFLVDETGEYTPYTEGQTGGTEWFSRSDAVELAAKLRLPLEEL